MVADRIEWLKRQIKAYDLLSVPCPAGQWRWADVDPNNYARRKSQDELARDREIAANRAMEYRRELAILEAQ
jgi:hypothetical protein